MGNQENEDFYHNLSRKELQGLCKKHGLSANKTNSHLAKLLVSHFQKKNASSASSDERSSGPMEVFLPTSPVSYLKSGAQLNPMGETHKGVHERRVEASDVDSCKTFSCSKEEDYEKRQPQTVNHDELGSHVGAQITHKVSGSTGNVVRRDPSSNGTAEGFGCSNNDLQEITDCSRFGSQCDDSGLKLKRKEPPKSTEARDSDQNLPGATRISGPGNIPQVQCRDISFGASPADIGFVSSNETCTEVPLTSFQFYVRSEEGINLHVDLSSSPSDWIKSLKNEVCINQKVHNSKSRVLHHELRNLGDSNEEMKASLLGNRGLGFQTKGDPVYIESSLSSIVRESSHLEVDHPDGTDRLLWSPAIIPTSAPVEIASQVEDDDQMVSSICEPNSDMHNRMDLGTEGCPRNGETLTLGLEVPNTSKIKSTGISAVDSKSDGSKSLDSLEHQSKSGSICLENAETGSVGTSSLSHARCHPLSSEICEDSTAPNTGILENPSGVLPRCSTSGSMDIQLSEVASHCEDTSNSPRPNSGRPDFGNLMHNLQTENGGSAKCELDQNTCKDPLFACPEEWGGSNSTNERQSSECSQIDNLLERTCKRSYSSEPEGLRSKRKHSNSQDHNSHTKPAVKNLRSAKNLAREVIPRRSMRLVSK